MQHVCKYQNVEAFKYLLILPECDCDAQSQDGNTVLHICYCIEKCSINIRNKDGATALHVALASRHYSLLKSLLCKVKPSELENCINIYGDNILHAAAADRHASDIVSFILSNKLIRHCSKSLKTGNTALHIACDAHTLESAKCLMEADLEYTPKSWYNKKHHSPLMSTIKHKNYSNFEEITSFMPKKYQQKPFYMCRWNDGSDIIEVPLVLFLIKHYMEPSQCCREHACSKVFSYIVELMDCDPQNVTDSLDNTVFHYLALCRYHRCEGFMAIVDKALNKHKNLVTKLNKHRESLLHNALLTNSDWMLKEVLDRGVPLEFIDERSEHRRLMQKMMTTGGLSDKFIHLMAKGVYHKADAQFVQDSLNNPCIHVLILGNSGVGKTTLINTLKCFCKLDYETSIQSTTGLVPTDFVNGKYRYQFYDFGGQMEFEMIHSRFLENRLATLADYYGQNAFVFILMVNAEESLEENKSQIERWTVFMKKHISDPNLSISTLLVCSHADRIENNYSKNAEVKAIFF